MHIYSTNQPKVECVLRVTRREFCLLCVQGCTQTQLHAPYLLCLRSTTVSISSEGSATEQNRLRDFKIFKDFEIFRDFEILKDRRFRDFLRIFIAYDVG